MASAQEPGMVIIKVFTPKTGTEIEVLRQRVEWVGPGGSSEGVPASTATPDVLKHIPIRMAPDGRWFYGGCELRVYFKSDAADGIDASDCIWAIPITLATSGVVYLTNTSEDFDVKALADYTAVAAQEQLVAIHRAPQGRNWAFGGDTIFMSFEDDTA